MLAYFFILHSAFLRLAGILDINSHDFDGFFCVCALFLFPLMFDILLVVKVCVLPDAKIKEKREDDF